VNPDPVIVTGSPPVLDPDAGETAVTTGGAGSTTTVALPLLAAKFGSPGYLAVKVGFSADVREVILIVAIPSVSGSVPSDVEPSKKVTEPVGVSFLGSNFGMTWAVRTTDWPEEISLGSADSSVSDALGVAETV